ncbi:MAG: hypothetical protein E7057_09245 [Lentisphaerae bacterium]|nr:hypothetical protein [Lentisphaerota bacterium]
MLAKYIRMRTARSAATASHPCVERPTEGINQYREQSLFLRKSSVVRFPAALTASYYLCQRLNRAKKLQKKKFFALQSMVPGVSYKDDKRKELEK